MSPNGNIYRIMCKLGLDNHSFKTNKNVEDQLSRAQLIRTMSSRTKYGVLQGDSNGVDSSCDFVQSFFYIL